MPTVDTILADLKSKSKEGTRKIYARHGLDADRAYGVSVADMKAIAKAVRKESAQQDADAGPRALQDRHPGGDVRAGMLVDGAEMTRAQLNEWAEGAAAC